MSRLLGAVPAWASVAAIAALVLAAMGFGYVQGGARESDRRDALELLAERGRDAARAVAVERGRQAVVEYQAQRAPVQTRARTLQKEIADAPAAALTEIRDASPPPPGTVDLRNAGDRVAFSARFVGLFDDAWRLDPRVSGDPAGASRTAGEAGVAASVTAAEVLAIHALNAELCTLDRLRYDRLIDVIERNRAALIPLSTLQKERP